MRESFVADYEEGAGFETPQEAFDNFPPYEGPPGTPTLYNEAEDLATWVYFENGIRVGSLRARRTDAGLWIVVSGEECVHVPDATPLPTVPIATLEALRTPLACSPLASAEFSYPPDVSAATPQQALAALLPDQRPPGEPTARIEQGTMPAHYVTWVYSDAGRKVGQVTAARTAEGLYFVTRAEWCAN